MLYKIFGMIFVALSGLAAAASLRSSARERLSEAEGVLVLLRFIRSQIDCFAKPLPRILAEVQPELYRKCGYAGELPPKELGELLENCAVSDSEVREILAGVCAELGRGYLREQLRTCDYYISLLERQCDALSASLPARRRALGAVCIAASLGTIIILF